MRLLVRLAVIALGVYLAGRYVPGVRLSQEPVDLLLVTVVLAAVNLLVRPVVRLLSLPFVLLTLGLFLVVVNAAMLGLAAALTSRLDVEGLVPAVLGALVISAVAWAADVVLPDRYERR